MTTLAQRLRRNIIKWHKWDYLGRGQAVRRKKINNLLQYILTETRKQTENPPAKKASFNKYKGE